RQGRHGRHGGGDRIRSEPLRPDRPRAVQGRRAPVRPRGRRGGRGDRAPVGSRVGNPGGQHAPAGQHPGRHVRARRRAPPGQGRPDGPQRGDLGSAHGERGEVRAVAAPVRRSAERPRRVPGDDRIGGERRAREPERREGRAVALARDPAAVTRRGHEPRGPSARRRRGQIPAGKSPQGNPHPVSPWGWHTKGKKTRSRKKPSSKYIVKRRP
ncbi:MAG: hypothetical protein H6Q29_719, partial [Bacteroidetes bacterium]|nr:hypothetical protein [Bacteroidota bacterium]